MRRRPRSVLVVALLAAGANLVSAHASAVAALGPLMTCGGNCGNGGGTGAGSSGNLSGGGGGNQPGRRLPNGDCGVNRILIVYSETIYGAAPPAGVYPAATAFYNPPAYNYVFPSDQTPNIRMVFPVDIKTGLVWGPPDLLNYNAALGEGDAPGLGSSFGPNNSPSFARPAAVYGNYSPGWACYTGTVPTVSVPAPTALEFDLSQPLGSSTVTDGTPGKPALVMSPVVASPGTVCPQDGNVVPTGGNYPNPPVTDNSSPGPACPDAGLAHGTDGTDWQWYIEAAPEYDESAQSCTAGSGAFKWNWQPAPYTTSPTNLTGKCTATPSDSETFTHVHENLPAPPSAVGVSIGLSVAWKYHCFGTMENIRTGDVWIVDITGSATAGASTGRVWNAANTLFFQFDCQRGYFQTYARTAPFAVDQIEVVSGS